MSREGGPGTLVIVGSGPVGMASALLLKDRFERVVVLERQSKERFLRTRGFTFPIVFAPAARAVLQWIGVLGAIEGERSPYFGVVIHQRFLGRDTRWTTKRGGIYSHWRNHILASLYDRLVAQGIEVHFDARVDDIDFDENVCREAVLGDIAFDLLLGSDGINSQTRSLMAEAHPTHGADAFGAELMDRWYAYRLPSTGPLDAKYGSDDQGRALHVHVDNAPRFPDDKFRVITVAMTQPEREVSVVVKYDARLSVGYAKRINASFFEGLVDPVDLERAWDAGVGGDYRHVTAPTYQLGSVLLVGDAAHGFEGNGDLINLGLSSVAALPDLLDRHDSIPAALAAYDASVGRSLRDYSDLALRRSLEELGFEFEFMAYELGALLGMNGHHPTMWGIYEDDFEITSYMQRYEHERRRIPIRLTALASLAGLAVFAAREAWRRAG